jgi:hypothetical protein
MTALDVDEFVKQQTRGRRKNLFAVVAIVALLALSAFGAFAVLRSTPCQTLASQLCSMAALTDCTELKTKLNSQNESTCRSTLDAMSATSDMTMKMAIATKAIFDLVPEAASELNLGLEPINTERRAGFREKKPTP